jgi:predicted O-methyltransferase YrrM
MKLRSRERLVVLVFGGLFLAGFYVGWKLLGPIVTVPALSLALTVLLLVGFDRVHRLRRDLRDHAVQMQSLLETYRLLETDAPLPALGGYILKHRPRLIVEAGSGSSTVLAAECLRQIGAGKVIALEHLPRFAELTRRNLASRGLSSFAEVRSAPLEPQTIDGREWMWFSVDAQTFDEPIDLLVVDGPPAGKPNREARFPALPRLVSQLNRQAWVIVDDAYRRGERRVLQRWRETFGELDYREEILPTKLGTAVIRLARSE